jgi:GNAT superfamily N-acetyltransferase
MHSTVVKTRAGAVTLRPLRNGDVATVQSVFDRLGDQSRRLRFGYVKPALACDELEELATMDGRRHVLIAVVQGQAVGIARLVRDDDPQVAEIASAVADDWQGLGIGTALLRALVADAAAAGITHVRAAIQLDNRASLSVLRKAATIVSRRVVGDELELVAHT